MRPLAIFTRSLKNVRRNALRTSLTAAAILVGALTLTLTSALGAGVNKYIDDTVASFGAEDVIFVTNPAETTETAGTEPTVFEEGQLETEVPGSGPQGGASLVQPIAETTVDEIRDIEGVTSVQPNLGVTIEYLRSDGDAYTAENSQTSLEIDAVLVAGSQLSDDSDFQVILPSEYLEPLGFADAETAVGQDVALGYYDKDRNLVEIDAKVAGVADQGLGGPTAGNVIMNPALIRAIHEIQFESTGEEAEYALVTVFVSEELVGTPEFQVVADDIEALGLNAASLEDQLGSFTAIVDAIIWILNGFALVVLLASGFGIVNTLYMSVQERTREIGLMKSIGATPRVIFALFSTEAVLIGLIGSITGIVLALILGTTLAETLQEAFLSDLVGLQLFVFEPQALLQVLLVVLSLALAAGILPARGASNKDPITALRYE
jgi:putative ABC transport system permease protein